MQTDLGDVVASFAAKRWPWWITVLAVLGGAMTIMMALDGGGGVLSPGKLAIGVAVIVAGIAAPFVQPRLASSVVVYERGLRVGRPGRQRVVHWHAITRMEADYRVVSVDRIPVSTFRLTLEMGPGQRLVLDEHSCREPGRMMRTVEEVSRPTLQVAIDQALTSGLALSVGTCHVVEKGWMVGTSLLPWNALLAFQQHDGNVHADFAAVGRVDLGRYPQVPLAWALLNLGVERARAGGTAARMFQELPIHRQS